MALFRAGAAVIGTKPGPVSSFFNTGRNLGPVAIKIGPKQGQSFITGPKIGPAGTDFFKIKINCDTKNILKPAPL